mgnify:CR=1 FL=1
MIKNTGDFFLFYPQWQGSGDTRELYWSAKILQKALIECNFREIKIAENEELVKKYQILGYDSILSQLNTASVVISESKPKKIFTIGGGCDVEIAPISYLNNLYKGDLAVVWLDAHGDLNTPESSPSKNFHGMPLRILLGEGEENILKLFPNSLNNNQVILIGTRDLDDPERKYISDHNISIATTDNLMKTLENKGYTNVYIHLDLDVIDPKYFNSVKCPASGGLKIQDVQNIISIANNLNVVGGSVVEYVYNPLNKDLEIARDLFFQISKR